MHFCLGVIYQNNIIFKTTRIQGETQVVTALLLIFIITICILGPLRPNLLAPVECTSTVITPVHGPLFLLSTSLQTSPSLNSTFNQPAYTNCYTQDPPHAHFGS